MAEDNDDTERTEDPTLKRLDEALERGDVVKSQEVSTWFVIAGATLVLVAFSGSMGSGLTALMRGLIANAHMLPAGGFGLLSLMRQIGFHVIAAIAVPFLLLALFAIAGNMIQHRLVWSGEQLKPKLSKISPLAGMKRLFSKVALVNFAKGLAKLALVGTVLTVIMWSDRDRLESFIPLDPAALLPITRSLSLELLGSVVAILAVVAAADFLFQYRQWYQRQKMSMRELKEEFKQTEGDPAVKGKIRRIREQRMRKRMMAAVPEASVIITNPTHYAIALKYERGDNAPRCLAKGVDSIAFKIREVGAAHNVPFVENPPLARALHATVEIDQEIPPEHYKAVAEVIGYVMKLRRAATH
jgi:flagellar biosynthetic protein FlhB